MESTPRRPYGQAKERVALFVKVDAEIKHKVEAVASALNVSQAVAAELMLASVEVDSDSRPVFMPSDAQGKLLSA